MRLRTLFLPDVPYDGPQTLAFPVPPAKVERLQRALRAAFEQEDGGPLQACWRAEIERFRESSRRLRWRVPARTLRTLFDELRRAAATAPIEHPTTAADREALLAECARWEAAVADQEHVDLPPDHWTVFAPNVLFRVRPYLTEGGIPPLSFEWGFWRKLLARLDEPPEDFDPAGDTPSMSMESAQEELWSSELDAHDRVALMRVSAQLEFVIGAGVMTRGPGPFLPVPAAATPLVDRSWSFAQAFRDTPWGDPDEVEVEFDPLRWVDSLPCYLLRPSQLDGVLDALDGATPDRAWTDELREAEEQAGGWGRDQVAGWLDWEAAVAGWWPRCKERYMALLSAARRDGDTVVFTRWIPEDTGTNHAPLSEDLGRPVFV